MTRRTFLFAGPLMAANPPRAAVQAVDHLVLGTADLETGIGWLRKRTGVSPVHGGVHPGRGTRNALLSLGQNQYLELIAPEPAQETGNEIVAMLKKLREPRLIGWAASTREIQALAARLGGTVLAGSRKRGDGVLLQWQSLEVSPQRFSVVPFFIQWSADSRHPSEDSPKGCTLIRFTLEHPQQEELRDRLAGLGIEAEVRQAPEPGLSAELRTPAGAVELR